MRHLALDEGHGKRAEVAAVARPGQVVPRDVAVARRDLHHLLAAGVGRVQQHVVPRKADDALDALVSSQPGFFGESCRGERGRWGGAGLREGKGKK